MKKLLLILTVVFVSVTSVFAGLNPYAYDLKSEWFPQTQILRVHFTLNDHPNTDQKIVNGKPTNETGIQIFALDRNNKSKLYCIYMVPAADIIAHINANNFQYDIDIPINGRDLATGEALPIDKDLTFAVRVQGLNSQNKSTPSDPIYASDEYRPYSCHGVAVNNYQDSPDFGAVFVTEAAKDDQLSGIWSWLRGRGKALLHYSPRMVYKASYKKTSSFSDRTNTTLEPHRVCVSDDGRIFITSYNRYDSGNKAIVWEYKNGEFIEVIKHNNNGGQRGAYGHRVCGMTVKGSGTNLRILLCFLEESDGSDPTLGANWTNSFRVYEYDLNTLGANKNVGTEKFRYKPSGNTYDVTSTNNGYMATSAQAALNLARYYKWYCYTDGFADIAYAGTNKNDIVLSVDFYNGNVYNTYMVYHKNGSGKEEYTGPQILNKQDHFYGGGGLLIYNDGTEYALSGRAQYGEYNAGGTNVENSGRIQAYKISGTTIANAATAAYSKSNLKTKKIINDMAMDCANNIYAVSFADGSQGSGRLLAFAMPYSGTTTTIAPNISTTQTFNLPPVPNILATDLCVTPHDKQAKYIFSFNVNTKPEGAEIRFYTSEQDMLNDSKQNATYSDYDNHDNCAYYYRFSSTELKQGRMSVELDILGHEGGKELTDKKLPSGKLYWNVFLKTRRSLAFSPIYVQPLEDASGTRTHYCLHATTDNNPDNEGFGHIYAIDYHREFTDERMKDGPCKLMVYTIGDAGVNDENTNEIKSTTRYSLVQSLGTNEMVQPRRPAVAPDGVVYLTDYGDYKYDGVDFSLDGTGPSEFKHGGIWWFDPALPDNKKTTGDAILSRFYEDDETVSDVCFYQDGNTLKLYKTNTYEEYSHHGTDANNSGNYQAAKWMNNGYRIYTMTYNDDGSIRHSANLNDAAVIPFKTQDKTGNVGGDANGNISVRAVSDGVWFCQNRKGTSVGNDNRENVALMFYNNSGQRIFQSHLATVDGVSLSQDNAKSIMKSTPGAGMTTSPDGTLLYVVNHDCDILEFKVSGNSSQKTLSLKNKYINTEKFNIDKEKEGISTLNFDYAGNLIATLDESYPAIQNEQTRIVVFTLPYNRDNARSIPASKAQREIPERLSYAEDEENTLATIAKTPTFVDLFRPMPNTSYSTICLPFALDISTLEDGHPYKTADIRAFEGAELSAVGGEKILYLNFSANPVTLLSANTPYIIQPSVRIPNLVQLPATHWNTDAALSGPYAFGDNNSITFIGVIPKQEIEVQEGKTLLLVAENRLAEMVPDKTVDGQPVGEILGFRGYFTLGAPLPKGMQAILRNKDNTVTGLVDINGKKVNINKYLREGRVYIRVGDTLYTVDGQLVK